MKKAFNIILGTFTALFFILALYIMVAGTKARKNNELLSIFGYSYSVVPTDSMKGTNEDSFDEGSFIISKKVKYEKINIEDVIVFQYEIYGNEALVIHRVIDIDEEGVITTRGDNNPEHQIETVTKDMYQAKMVRHFKIFNLGNSVVAYQMPVIGLLLIMLTIYAIYQFVKLIIMVQKERFEKIKKEVEEDITNNK